MSACDGKPVPSFVPVLFRGPLDAGAKCTLDAREAGLTPSSQPGAVVDALPVEDGTGGVVARDAAHAPAPAGAAWPGFVRVPAGQVWPGCTEKEYKERHLGNSDLKRELIYDVWGKLPPFPLPSFQIGKFEVTNAQWKQYLDLEFRVEHKTGKGETLRSVAGQYVKFRGAEPKVDALLARRGLK